jgi:hypothetical protein
MTMKLIKASVGIAGVLALFACAKSSDGTGTAGTAGGSAGEGPGTAGASGSAGGTAGGGSAGSSTAGTGAAGATGSGGASGQSGATGAAGQAGAGGSGTAGTTATDDSVLERGKNPSRTGNYTQPSLTTAAAKGTAAMKVMPDATFNTNAVFASPTTAMYTSPLYLAKGPGGNGIFIAATTNNDVKAFDDTGMPVWTRSFTNPTSGGALSPKGVMGTPVIDTKTGPDGFATIYACAPAAAMAGGKMDRYELHAISAKDGTERAGWPAKLDNTVKAANDGLNRAFNPVVEAQRPALSLVNGIVYIGFGGPFGDFGSPYYGWVIAVDTTNPTTIGAWSTRLEGDAIWTPGGFASDGNGVIITTGNYFPGSYTSPPTWGDNEAVIRLTGMPSALTRDDAYFPARWAFMDTNDQDLGSSSVMLLNVPGATPANYAVTVSKDSHLYFLNSATLGMTGGGGEIIDMTLSPSNHSARTSPVAYTTASGIHLAITVDRGPYTGCPVTTPAVAPGLSIVMGLTVTPGSPIKVTQNWCTNVGGPAQGDTGTVRNRSASPLVTTIDGSTQPIIWVGGSTSQAGPGTSANLLYGLDGETGAVLYSGGNCQGIRQWTTPIAVKGHIVVGGDGHLCSWSAQ